MSVTTVGVMSSRPDPEVRPARQCYPPAYKLRILAELDVADSKTERGEIMRREGLYSSLISAWRDQRDLGALASMRQAKPGPKTDPVRVEVARLRARVVELESELATAQELIDAQGKVSALLQQHSRQSADRKRS